jgi:hypothetical protein
MVYSSEGVGRDRSSALTEAAIARAAVIDCCEHAIT